ncbi:MAG: hypothetical protein WDN28_24180 [Chthoniobacter sp.]
MKLSSVLILAPVSLLLAACNSLDNPITNFFHSGTSRDARVYNTQTGEWEWPADKRKAQEKKSAAVASALATSAPNDTRYWDAQRNQWVQAEEPRTSSSSKPQADPAPCRCRGAGPGDGECSRGSRPRSTRLPGHGRLQRFDWQDRMADFRRQCPARRTPR